MISRSASYQWESVMGLVMYETAIPNQRLGSVPLEYSPMGPVARVPRRDSGGR